MCNSSGSLAAAGYLMNLLQSHLLLCHFAEVTLCADAFAMHMHHLEKPLMSACICTVMLPVNTVSM